MKRMSVKKSVRFPQAVKLEAGNGNFLSVLIQLVHSLRRALAMLLTDRTASATLSLRNTLAVFFL